MNLSDLSKLILAVCIGLSCAGISVQIMRLLSALTDNVKDFRSIVKNLNLLVAGFVKDQEMLSSAVKGIVDMVDKVKGIVSMISEKVVKPITAIFGFLTYINSAVETIKTKYLSRRKK